MTTTPKLIVGKGPTGTGSIKVLPVAPEHQKASLVIDRESLLLMEYFVDHNPIECMWYSTIEPYPVTTPGTVAWRIAGVYIPYQTAAEKEVEATPAQKMQMFQDLKKNTPLDNQQLADLMRACKVWIHSHVMMPVNPSPQDDKQWDALMEEANNATTKHPVAMIIFNRLREYSNRVYDPVTRTLYTNIGILVEDNIDYSYIEEAILKKVAKKEVPKTLPAATHTTTPAHSQGSHSSHGPQWVNQNASPISESADSSKLSSEGLLTFKSGESNVTIALPDQKKTPPTLVSQEDLVKAWEEGMLGL